LALGKAGANKRRIAHVSGCVVEYVGCAALLYGDITGRKLARNFLTIFLERGRGIFSASRWENALGISTVNIPVDQIGWITGKQGSGLHGIEDSCDCICFVSTSEPPSQSGSGSLIIPKSLPPPLLKPGIATTTAGSSNQLNGYAVMIIMGRDDNTQRAAKMITDRLRGRQNSAPRHETPLPNETAALFFQLFKKNGARITIPSEIASGSGLMSVISQASLLKPSEISTYKSPLSDLTIMSIPATQSLSGALIKQIEEEYNLLIGIVQVDHQNLSTIALVVPARRTWLERVLIDRQYG
jgi:hypothetical protein